MRFYYTTSISTDSVQGRPDLSLGGYRSSNVVPNNTLNNLFGDVSIYSIQSKKDEYVGLILRNDTGIDVTNVKLWFNYPTNCQVIYSIAAVTLTNGWMEHIESCYQSPYYATFHEANGEANAVDLGDLDSGDVIGVWIKKTIDSSAINAQYSDDNLKVNGSPVEEDESIGIVMSWSNIVGISTSTTGLFSATGSSTISLSPVVSGLSNGLVVEVTKDDVSLTLDTDYTLTLADDEIVISFLEAAGIVSESVVLVILTKTGYLFDDGEPITIPILF